MKQRLEVALERLVAAKRDIDSIQDELPTENGQLAMTQYNLRQEIERLESVLQLLDATKILRPVA